MKSSSVVFFCLPQFYEENTDGVMSVHSSSVEMTLQPEPHKGREERGSDPNAGRTKYSKVQTVMYLALVTKMYMGKFGGTGA